MHASSLVEQGRAWLACDLRMRNPKKTGIDLLVVRWVVFNEVPALPHAAETLRPDPAR